MTIGEIISVGYPNATQDEMDTIMWSRTSYPFKHPDAKEIYKTSAREYRIDLKGIQLCDFCNRIATKNGLCDIHNKVLEKING